ncbi:MAG: MarR family transcriptional regulator [Alphaproteobacteria bacterium]|nr:MarR family transcriptional regulator [Alphaproteobacteria bacterium]
MTEARTLAALVERLGRMSHALQFSTGLNPSQWEALRYLARANRYSASPTALAKYLGITKGTVSQTIIALESKGLVTRVRGRPDGRSVHLELTDEGRNLLCSDPLRVVNEAGGCMTDAEREATIRGMNKLLDALCQEKGRCGFGVCGDCTHLDSRPCAKGGGEGCFCGLANESLATEDLQKLCVNFQSAP